MAKLTKFKICLHVEGLHEDEFEKYLPRVKDLSLQIAIVSIPRMEKTIGINLPSVMKVPSWSRPIIGSQKVCL